MSSPQQPHQQVQMIVQQQQQLQQHKDMRQFDSDGEFHEDGGNYINDELKYGAGHQSIDSNPVESQSEWSDDECREEATGKFLLLNWIVCRN